MLASLRFRLPLVCAMVLLVGVAGYLPRANASLIGTNVDVSLIEVQGSTVTTYYSNTVTVIDPGAEVVNLFNSFNVNIGAASIRLDITATGTIGTADFLGFTFESLVGAPPMEIIGFTQADSDIVGFDLTHLLFNANAVAFDLQGLSLVRGNYVDVRLDLRSVPEPSTLLLFLAAGAGLMGWTRSSRARLR